MIFLVLTALSSPAFAAPDRIAASLTTSGNVTDLSLAPDGRALAAVTDGGSLLVLDTFTWTAVSAAPCSDAGGVGGVALSESDDTLYLTVGCADGSASIYTVNDDGSLGDDPVSVDVGSAAICAIEADEATAYVAWVEDSDVHVSAVDLASGALSTPVDSTLGSAGCLDSGLGSGRFYTLGPAKLSWMDTSSGTAASTNQSLSVSFVDLWMDTETTGFLADDQGKLVRFSSGNSTRPFSILESDYESVTAVGGVAGSWLLMAADDSLITRDLTSTTPGDTLATFDAINDVGEIVGWDDYAFLAAEAALQIATDLPWITLEGVPTEDLVVGDAVDFSFTSDTSGTYTVTLNDVSVASGSVTADAPTAISFVTDSTLVEGINELEVSVTADSLTGHTGAYLVRDMPPGAVSLKKGDLLPGDNQLLLSFDVSDEEDGTTYTVYLSDTPFQKDDYASGGPSLTVGTNKWPKDGYTSTSGTVSITLSPLRNYTTYYVAVRAIDSSGKESTMSKVLSAMPEPTLSLSERAGEEGWSCAAAPMSSLAPLGLAAAAAIALSRRRRAALLAAPIALVVGASAAQAAEPVLDTNYHHTAFTSWSLRFGPGNFPDDTNIAQSFTSDNKRFFRAEYGKSWEVVDVQLGAGGIVLNGNKRTVSGVKSGEEERLTILPVNLDVGLRLQLTEKQPIYPYARIGGDYWLWRNSWEVSGQEKRSFEAGGKAGWHWAGGGAVRLDGLDEASASHMKVNFDIEDTWLVGEYRKNMLPADGLQLSSWEATFGLRFDY